MTLNEGCWETCFGLKRVDIQTAGESSLPDFDAKQRNSHLLMTSGFMDVNTASLEQPEVARQAILLTAKQYRSAGKIRKEEPDVIEAVTCLCISMPCTAVATAVRDRLIVAPAAQPGMSRFGDIAAGPSTSSAEACPGG